MADTRTAHGLALLIGAAEACHTQSRPADRGPADLEESAGIGRDQFDPDWNAFDGKHRDGNRPD